VKSFNFVGVALLKYEFNCIFLTNGLYKPHTYTLEIRLPDQTESIVSRTAMVVSNKVMPELILI
jgi:hypothetical protein